MGFTTPAFIRKNTPELRKKLERLGYHLHPECIDDDRGNYLFVNREYYLNRPLGYPEELSRSIDCGTNESLFLAITALRDDTDDSQWFVYSPENIWFICDDDDINYARENTKDSVQAAWFHCSHKATVEELIEHFKSV
jgi:hypothetical protein